MKRDTRKKPTYSKEINKHGKKCTKKSNTKRETYIHEKRPIYMKRDTKATYIFKGDLYI